MADCAVSGDGWRNRVAQQLATFRRRRLAETWGGGGKLDRPRIWAPWMTASPTAPRPKTATELPSSTSQVFLKGAGIKSGGALSEVLNAEPSPQI